MNLLITGGCGFVGQKMIKRIPAGDVVVSSAQKRIDCAKRIKQVIVSDIGPDTDWSECLDDIDVIIHLAARAHVLNETSEKPLELFRKVNTFGTINLAKQAAEAGVKRFVFVSSIGVNGNKTSEGRAINEKSPINPQADYAISKYEAEEGLRNLSSLMGFELVIVRPTLVYGFGAPGNFGNLVNLVEKLPFLPFGITHNLRSFISVDNLADFLYLCAHHQNAAGETFVISDGEDVSTKQLTNAIAQGLKRRGIQIPVPVIFMRLVASILGKSKITEQLLGNLRVDSNKARKVLGWIPPQSSLSALKMN